MRRFAGFVLVAVAVVASPLGLTLAQDAATTRVSRDHAAIQYSTRDTSDAVATLNQKLRARQLQLTFDTATGYLRSLLAALDISPASQTLVYSPTSLQADEITQRRPRALYFNDRVAVGWVQGSNLLEVAAQDPSQGVVFYTLRQAAQPQPALVREARCLECHAGTETGGVPGIFVMSTLPLSDNKFEYAQGWPVDHRTPIEDRWGGWYVTGAQVPARHLGNVPVSHVARSYTRAAVAPKLTSVAGVIDSAAYLSPHSDVVALLILNHQAHATNLLTRLGWEARIATEGRPPGSAGNPSPGLRDTARELVDYFLFVDEAPLPSAVRGTSAFAREFSARGPRDRNMRSLRELDLERRLFRYRCSYMIYTEAFDALPPMAKGAVYDQLWRVLSGKETDKAYARLPLAERNAIVEILRETKAGLPDYFRP